MRGSPVLPRPWSHDDDSRFPTPAPWRPALRSRAPSSARSGSPWSWAACSTAVSSTSTTSPPGDGERDAQMAYGLEHHALYQAVWFGAMVSSIFLLARLPRPRPAHALAHPEAHGGRHPVGGLGHVGLRQRPRRHLHRPRRHARRPRHRRRRQPHRGRLPPGLGHDRRQPRPAPDRLVLRHPAAGDRLLAVRVPAGPGRAPRRVPALGLHARAGRTPGATPRC